MMMPSPHLQLSQLTLDHILHVSKEIIIYFQATLKYVRVLLITSLQTVVLKVESLKDTTLLIIIGYFTDQAHSGQRVTKKMLLRITLKRRRKYLHRMFTATSKTGLNPPKGCSARQKDGPSSIKYWSYESQSRLALDHMRYQAKELRHS